MEAHEIIATIYQNVRLNEGIRLLNAFFVHAWLREGQSVKEMALRLKLPVPVVSAIKNECKRQGMAAGSNGIRLTAAGTRFVTDCLHYGAIQKERLLRMLDAPDIPFEMFLAEADTLADFYRERPAADVTVDQSLCTAETGIRRALLMLRTGGLTSQKIFFAGDDDLTSVALWLIIKSLSHEPDPAWASLTVMDIDERVLNYITQLAGGGIVCLRHDFRAPVPEKHTGRYDTLFTDPPYTLPGLRLFIHRGLEALKPESDLTLYVSCARKSPAVRLAFQQMYCEAGLVIERIYEGFNRYHGAQILGGVSDLTVLSTTDTARPDTEAFFGGPLYTNETNRHTRIYQCKQCRAVYRVGHGEKMITIERLKEHGCTDCGGKTFLLKARTAEKL